MSDPPRDPPIVDDPPIRLAVCVSGGGTTLQNLMDRIAAGRLRAEVVQVVASRPGIGAIAGPRRRACPSAVVSAGGKSLADVQRGGLRADPRPRGPTSSSWAASSSLVAIPPDYQGRVINIHPALIPAFCGKGFHGEAVHQAALDAGVKVSGCTVHFADATYDTGPIILQRTVPVHDDDTPEALAARVFEAECEALPEAIAPLRRRPPPGRGPPRPDPDPRLMTMTARGHDPYAPFRYPDFRRYMLAGTISTVGGQMQSVAVGWELYERHGLGDGPGAGRAGPVPADPLPGAPGRARGRPLQPQDAPADGPGAAAVGLGGPGAAVLPARGRSR